jgi:hypothetical protein
MSSWQIVLLEPARTVLSQIGQFMVNILLVVIILIIGWSISKLIKSLVTKGLKVAKLDELSEKIGLAELLGKGGMTYSLSDLIGVICYWLGLLISFMVAINAVGLTVAADLLNKVVIYVPNVIAAIFILILGMFVATLLKNIVITAANNAGMSQGNFLSKIVEIIVVVFSVLIGLEQLGVGVKVTEITWSIILGSIGLGLALAFGLGCKEIAAKFTSDLIDKMKKK